MNNAPFSRRDWLKSAGAFGLTLATAPFSSTRVLADEGPDMIDIGSRRELFVDDYLIAHMSGAELKLHKPVAREVVLTCDATWEGNTSWGFASLADEDRFRAYYRGWHFDEKAKKMAHPPCSCYAESRDGIHWVKPELGLSEFNDSKANNILPLVPPVIAPFKDGNPNCAPDARYKTVGVGKTTLPGKDKPRHCLHAFKSPDGIHWSMMAEAVITEGAFDSQNLAFWDAERGEYRAYWRYFTAGYTDERGWKPSGYRAIRTATSKDFIHWENVADLKYVDSPDEHLYENAVMPYFRAPHLFIAFPTRFYPKTQQVEPVFMTSRDGVLFRRWDEALIPTTAPKDRDGNRSNYMCWGLLQLPGHEGELSVYATEAYYTGPGSRVRRFTYRTDGFVSVHAEGKASVVTKPLIFSGERLKLNFVASTGGALRVEIQNQGGKPIPGFTLADSHPLEGDQLDGVVSWKSGTDVSQLADKPVQLKFEVRDADLYAFQFTTGK